MAVCDALSSYIDELDQGTNHCVRVISDTGAKTRDEMLEEYISREDQPFPFVMSGMSYTKLRGKTVLEMFQFIGFQTDWAKDDWLFRKLASGTRFWLVVFGEGNATPATWAGIMDLTRQQSPACAEKLAPHMEIMANMSIEELVELARRVDKVDAEYYATVGTFEGYAASDTDTLEHARAFLRHTLKCTTLYRGDGYAYDDQGVRGSEEVLMPRVKIGELPVPSTGNPSPLFCLSDDPLLPEQIEVYQNATADSKLAL